MYIANFVPFEYAKSIIIPADYESNSTFALRSLRSIEILEEIEGDTTVGDRQERHAIHIGKKGKECHSVSGATIMVSCWTKIKKDYVTDEEWKELYRKGGKDRFGRTDGIAIVSTTEKMAKFLKENNERFMFGKERELKGGDVSYYNESEPKEKPVGFDPIFGPVFQKRDRYKYQSEYRFAYALPSEYSVERSIYYIDKPEDYIDKIQFGPEMKCQNIRKLLYRASGIFVSLIHEFDELQRIIRCPLIKFQEEHQ
ncbi:MAG: hypothetical protein MUO33_07860 [Sedimentisphaerales bacterium]|nr:hypothetical protein [Sedimentisphaerales bacterium]